MAEMRIAEINRIIESSPEDAISAAEREYHSRVLEIAEHVKSHSKIRIILLAGPSGSGKTTTANLIRDALVLLGEESIVVSLDDFYRDATDPEYPRFENGERDFERPEALHLEEIGKTLGDIAEGRAFTLPKYDFKIAARADKTRHAPMPHGCVIIEGLHALNPKIYESLPQDKVLKIFVSVSTNINNSKGKRIISGRKIRFVRRLVRDYIYRAADAERTLSLWRNVLAAEDVYLYPYKKDADMAFDTFHVFELGVMKVFADKLLTTELAAREPYINAVRTALSEVLPVDEALVPQNSLIREFIPGGIYEELY